jgi:hypothetical protein
LARLGFAVVVAVGAMRVALVDAFGIWFDSFRFVCVAG